MDCHQIHCIILKAIIITQHIFAGYASLRDTDKGTWFIKEFVATMKEMHRKDHLENILIEVWPKQEKQDHF